MNFEPTPWTYTPWPDATLPNLHQQYGAPAFGQLQWDAPIGPLGSPRQPGLPGTALNPGTRAHSFGPIPEPGMSNAMRTFLAGDAAAADEVLREIEAKRTTSDIELRKRSSQVPPTRPTADGTIAGRISLEQAKKFERVAYPERYRGNLRAFMALADNVALALKNGEAVTTPQGTVELGISPITLLRLYLDGAATGQIDHPAYASKAFVTALKRTYDLAHLVQHIRLGKGEAVRWTEHTGRSTDWAWLYHDEAATPFLSPGYVSRHQVHYAPGPSLSADILQSTRELEAALSALRDELAGSFKPGTPKVKPGTSSAGLGRGALTLLLATAAAGLIYARYARSGRGWWRGFTRRKSKGGPSPATTLLN